MKITIPGTPYSEIEIFHDIDGNILFQMLSTKEYYYLSISSSNDIELIKIENFDNMVDIENTIKYENIKNTSDGKSLRSKIMNKIDEESEEEYSDEDVENEDYFKYYPEDKHYYVERDEGSDSDIEEYDSKFLFSKCGDDTVLECLKKTLDAPANYDTLVFDDVNKMTLATLECNDKSNYRVTLLTSGMAELNVVGSKIRRYKPVVSSDGTLLFENISNNNIIK